jgi:hypothetical protein
MFSYNQPESINGHHLLNLSGFPSDNSACKPGRFLAGCFYPDDGRAG